MYIGRSLGFSLNPIHAVKSAAKAVGHGAQAVGHGAATGGKYVAHHAKTVAALAVFPPAILAKYIAEPILMAALTPVRRKVNTLKDRRAKKLAWDRRKSTTPNQAEKSEARSWAKSTLKHEKPPFGLMLSFLAGPPPATTPLLFGRVEAVSLGALGDPTTATIISSIPILLKIMDDVLSHHGSDAPAGPGGGAPGAPGAPGAGGGGGGAGGGGDAAADDGSDGGGSGGGGGKGGGAMILGMPKKYVIIGGAVLGGVLVLSLLTSRKG